jgi:hypothetical protein
MFFLAIFAILLEAPCDCGSVNETRVLQSKLETATAPVFAKELNVGNDKCFWRIIDV